MANLMPESIQPTKLGSLVSNKFAHIPKIKAFGLKPRKPRLAISQPKLPRIKV